jgi:hypothetical protein
MASNTTLAEKRGQLPKCGAQPEVENPALPIEIGWGITTSAVGNDELAPALFIGRLGGFEIEIAKGVFLCAVFGKHPESLPDDAVVLHLAAMPIPEHEDRRNLFRRCPGTWLRCPTGFLFFPQPFDFVCESIALVAQSGVGVRLLRNRVRLLDVLSLRSEQRRVGKQGIGIIKPGAQERIAEAAGSYSQAVMVPESGVDEKRMSKAAQRHEADAATRNAPGNRHHAGRRRGHTWSDASSWYKSTLGLEARGEDRDRPHCREQKQEAHRDIVAQSVALGGTAQMF